MIQHIPIHQVTTTNQPSCIHHDAQKHTGKPSPCLQRLHHYRCPWPMFDFSPKTLPACPRPTVCLPGLLTCPAPPFSLRPSHSTPIFSRAARFWLYTFHLPPSKPSIPRPIFGFPLDTPKAWPPQALHLRLPLPACLAILPIFISLVLASVTAPPSFLPPLRVWLRHFLPKVFPRRLQFSCSPLPKKQNASIRARALSPVDPPPVHTGKGPRTRERPGSFGVVVLLFRFFFLFGGVLLFPPLLPSHSLSLFTAWRSVRSVCAGPRSSSRCTGPCTWRCNFVPDWH